MSHKSLVRNIRWLGYAGFLLSGKKLIYINPYKLNFPEVGDMIVITDNLSSHCSPDDVKWLRKGSTIIVGPASCTEKFHGDIRTVKPGDIITVIDTKIEVVAAQAVSSSGCEIDADGVGYIFHLGENNRIYHAGRIKDVPETQEISCDIALLPVGGGCVMSADEAARFANQLKPKIAIPMDLGSDREARSNSELFAKLCETEVAILKQEP